MLITVTTPGVITAPRRRTASQPLTAVTRTITGYASRCGSWAYEHEDHEPETVWWAVYLPTRQRALFGNVTDARRETASGALRVRFHAEDLATLTLACPGGCGRPAAALVNTINGPAPVCTEHRPVIERRGFTTRVPVDPSWPVESRCTCGGLVVLVDTAGAAQHVDACEACHTPDGVTSPCPDPATHAARPTCKRPDPARCPHHRCTDVVRLTAGECAADLGECSGCCHGE